MLDRYKKICKFLFYYITSITFIFYFLLNFFRCELCNYASRIKQELKQHIQTVHEGKTFDCSKCSKKYITKGALRNHIKMVHDGIRKHICDYPECANKLFPFAIQLRNHIEAVHKGTKNEICDECGKGFFNKYLLAKHKSRHHNPGRAKYNCDFTECQGTFEKLKDLMNHKKIRKYTLP